MYIYIYVYLYICIYVYVYMYVYNAEMCVLDMMCGCCVYHV